MRNGYRVIDTDSHQMEPPRIWADYIDPAFADRAPRIGDIGGGRPGMTVEGEPITKQDGSYPMHSEEFHEAAARGMGEARAGGAEGFSPQARLRDMDQHGIDAQVLYPTVGGQMLGKEFHDTELLAAVCALTTTGASSIAARRRSGCAWRRCCRCRRRTLRWRRPSA